MSQHPTPRTDALINGLVSTGAMKPAQATDQAWVTPDAVRDLIFHARQLEHDHVAAAPTSAEQMAACRIVCGELRRVLAVVRGTMQGDGPTVKLIDETLSASEPHALDVIAKARAVVAAQRATAETESAWHDGLQAAADALAAALPPEVQTSAQEAR